jgi:hypothetical protein
MAKPRRLNDWCDITPEETTIRPEFPIKPTGGHKGGELGELKMAAIRAGR